MTGRPFIGVLLTVANCSQMLLMGFLNFVKMKDLWPRSPSGDTEHLQLFPCLELSYVYSVLSFRMNKEDILVWERVKEGKVSIVPVSGSWQPLKDGLSLELLLHGSLQSMRGIIENLIKKFFHNPYSQSSQRVLGGILMFWNMLVKPNHDILLSTDNVPQRWSNPLKTSSTEILNKVW